MTKKPKKKVVLLSGGNPQIAKADGDAPALKALIREAVALNTAKKPKAKR